MMIGEGDGCCRGVDFEFMEAMMKNEDEIVFIYEMGFGGVKSNRL